MKTVSILVALTFISAALPAFADTAEQPIVAAKPVYQPQPTATQGCRQINKGGPIAGIVVASVFWPLLPMSIPVWITQAKKLKKRKRQIYEQRLRGCPY